MHLRVELVAGFCVRSSWEYLVWFFEIGESGVLTIDTFVKYTAQTPCIVNEHFIPINGAHRYSR